MNNVTTFDNFPPFATNGSRNMNTESAKYAVGFLEGETFPAEWANYLFHGATKGVSDLNTAVQSIWKENINVIQGSGQTPSSSDNTQLKTAIELMIQNAVLTANAQVLAQAKLDAQNAILTANAQVLAQAKLDAQNAILTANAQVLAQAKLDAQNAILTANAQVLAQAKLDAHPVGSLYWSSKPTDPSILFGGTWKRIKDRFVLAAGDTYGNGATGGTATVKLTESNLPAHSHICNSVDINHTHDMSHGHSGSVSGSVGKTNVDHKHYFSWTGSHQHGVRIYSGSRFAIGNSYGTNSSDFRANPIVLGGYRIAEFYRPLGESISITVAGDSGYSKDASTSLDHSHSWSGSVSIDTLWQSTGWMSANWSHSHTVNGGGNGTASGNAHENMPPYLVKFCWERTA